MALRGLNQALNQVNVGKKVTEKPVAVRRTVFGDIANTRNATGAQIAKKVLTKVEEPKVKQINQATREKQQLVLTEELNKLEITESFSQNQLSTIEDIDVGDRNHPHLVSEWVNEIYDYLRELEAKYVVRSGYLGINNKEIKPRMRALLVDWLTQVHARFNMQPETLYLTVSVLDRVLQDLEIRRDKLQLVGVTSMLIAAKYEEMFAPEIEDFVYVCDRAYTKRDMKQMEIVILQQLDFALGRPVPPHFLRRNSKAGKATSATHTLAKYLMELTLVRYDMVHYAPSHLAAAALYLSFTLLRDSSWTPTLTHYSKYSEKELMPLVEKLALIAVQAEVSEYKTVRAKYASEKFNKISTSKCLKSETIMHLANAAKVKSTQTGM